MKRIGAYLIQSALIMIKPNLIARIPHILLQTGRKQWPLVLTIDKTQPKFFALSFLNSVAAFIFRNSESMYKSKPNIYKLYCLSYRLILCKLLFVYVRTCISKFTAGVINPSQSYVLSTMDSVTRHVFF